MTNLPSSQADAMIRRVSPEGRALAQRERERKQRAAARLAGRMALAGLIIAIVATVINFGIAPIGIAGLVVAILAFLVACVAIGLLSREQPVALAQSRLDALPDHTERWLEQQRPLLPRETVPLLDSIGHRLRDMAPQLAVLDAKGPAADSVRRLLATDLPALVRGYEAVPASLRSRVGASGGSADLQLLHGLGVIDDEIGRMTEQLARSAFDELATQDRFLELKYDGAGGLA
ncbi:hypothetical protein U1872_19945 [Sphingomonas sp. RB3P16]|uniref:hypothetical protein n=1 Tax=Parasphingomonas frigoris TaxID=3096163 RepID=UPI002FC7B35A